MKRLLIISLFALSTVLAIAPRDARADLEIFPESRHHLLQTYGLFIDQQCTAAWLGASQYWAAVSEALPVAGEKDSIYHPQVLLLVSATDWMNVAGGGGVYTYTLDTRAGVMVEGFIPQIDTNVSIGFLNEAGHTVDGTDSPQLGPLDLDYDFIRIRLVRDFFKKVRVGITLNPLTNSIPSNAASVMDEFAEYFPWGSGEVEHRPSPFIAMSTTHAMSFSGQLTFHAQMGLAWGDHFEEKHQGDVRTVVGYYNGTDPRAKYAQYLGSVISMGYVGVMFSI